MLILWKRRRNVRAMAGSAPVAVSFLGSGVVLPTGPLVDVTGISASGCFRLAISAQG